MSNIYNYGKKYKLSQSVDHISKIRNNKSNNIKVIQNNNINDNININPHYYSSNENYHYNYGSNSSQINRNRGKSSEKNRYSEKKVNNYNTYNSSETKIILDAKIKPNINRNWENMQFNKKEDQRKNIPNNYENNDIKKYFKNKNDGFLKENNKNKYLNKNKKYYLRGKSADPKKIGSRINSYNTNGSNMKYENLGNTMFLLEKVKRGTKQTQNNKNNNNYDFNNNHNIHRINLDDNSNKDWKNINNKNINSFKKNNVISNNRNNIINNNNFLGFNNNIMNFYSNNNAMGFSNNINYNISSNNNNYSNGIYNNINLINNFIKSFNSNNNINSYNNFFNFNLNNNMQNNNNNNMLPVLFNNFSNMNFMQNNNFNNGIGMGMGFNNFIQSSNSINHTRSRSLDRFSSNNKIFNNFNLNNSNINNIIKRTENCSKFNVTINSPSAKGLENVGATCYMNATLQCLANIEYLTKFLLDKYNNISPNKKLTKAYTEVLHNLWQNRNIDYYTPTYFKNTISKMNSLFAGVQANDSKDLVLFLMETIHNELNKPIKSKNQRRQLFPNQNNYDITFCIFSEYFMENYRSVISDLFYGMYNSMMKCLNCNVITHNVQCFNILIFPLEEVRKFKKRVDKIVDIKECFEFYQKYENMTGDNQIYCNNCNTMSNSCNCTKLIICPNVLVINLNRGKGLEFDVKLNFGEYLNIKEFVYYSNASPTNYELIGIVTHFGPSSMSGHFIAFCKSFVDHQWYKYNDAIVTPSSFSEASTTGIQYILFYSKI